MNNKLLEIIPTKAMLYNKNKNCDDNSYKAITFESHKKKISVKSKNNFPHASSTTTTTTSKNVIDNIDEVDNFIDMKSARHDVFKFGISGFDSTDKKAAKIALAVKLGAKPPKKVYKNYKELLAEKKSAKLIAEERLKLQKIGKNSMGAAPITFKSYQQKRKRKIGTITEHYGVVNPKINKKK